MYIFSMTHRNALNDDLSTSTNLYVESRVEDVSYSAERELNSEKGFFKSELCFSPFLIRESESARIYNWGS